jgi:ATP-dependent DNA helicase RecG
MHSDYFSGAKPRIRAFSDRLEFFNPGSLPKKIEYIIKEDFSLPRNPTIARCFRILNLAETMGSGFYKMINGWKSYYRIEPEIAGDFDYYKIVFRYKPLKNVPVNVPVNVPEERLTLLLGYMKANDRITMGKMADLLKVDVKTIKRDIAKLKKEGVVRRTGSYKKGKWEIIA